MTDGEAIDDADPPRPDRRFWILLGVITALALAVRLAFVWSRQGDPLGGDPYYYHHQANLVADGKGFVNPLRYAVSGELRPAADHPPLYVVYLALWSLAGATSVLWHQLATMLLGLGTVVLLGLAGRRLAGDRAGLAVAVFAALAPNLWQWEALLQSESIAITCVAAYLLAVVQYLHRPARGTLVLVGLAAVAAGLARSELVLLALAVVPLAVRTRGVPTRTRVGWVAVAGLVGAAAVAPWAIHNQTRFDRPVVLSTGLGLVMVSSTCDSTFYGPLTGYWDFGCSAAGNTSARTDDLDDSSVQDERLRTVAADYRADHRGRLPAVLAARVARMFHVYRPVQQARLAGDTEGNEPWVAGAALTTWYLFAGLAVVGAAILRRHGVPLVALTAPIAVMVVTALLTYGIGRFRAPADTVVILLAGVAVDALARRRWPGPAPGLADSVLGSMRRGGRQPDA